MPHPRMPALRSIVLVVLAVWGTSGHTAGLGPIRVQSALGQPLRVNISLLGDDTNDIGSHCIKAKVESSDGVYIATPKIGLMRAAQSTSVNLSTNQNINEPAVNIQLEIGCATFIQRNYQILLDPPVILAKVAETSQPKSAEPVAKVVQLERQPVALASAASPAGDSPVRVSSRRRGGQKPPMQDTTKQDEVKNTPAEPKKMALSTHIAGKKIARSVLRLSGDDRPRDEASAAPGLRLTDSLSESRDTGDAQKAAELKAAHDRFAAILKDEDLVQSKEAQMQTMQARMEALEKESIRIKQQNQADKATIDGMRNELFSFNWIVGLAGILLACLGAIAWLVWRLFDARRKKPKSFWEKTLSTDETIAADWDETAINEELAATDWEHAAPVDNVPSVDWASRQSAPEVAQQIATVKSDTVKPKQPQTNAVLKDQTAEQNPQPVQDRLPEDDAVPVTPAIAREGLSLAQLSARPAFDPASLKRGGDVHLLQVEEISDLMQEAEFWMLLNDPERAIEILEPYRDVEKPASPVPWIYLLDLYHVMGEREKFDALTKRIEQVFNAKVPSWSTYDNEEARKLESYPHIVQTIHDLWEGDYIVPFLESLLFDDRDGAREGFDLSIYREIIQLIRTALDPQVPRRREQLNFGEASGKLISQQVTNSGEKTQAADAGSAGTAVEKASGVQDGTAAQTTPKPAKFKSATFQPETPAAPVPPMSEPMLSMEELAPPAASIEFSPSSPVEPPSFLVAPIDIGKPDAPAENAVRAQADSADTGNQYDLLSDMEMKLDLASAYQEIGENVGARVLLEEVIKGGTPAQAEKAAAMLDKLLKKIGW